MPLYLSEPECAREVIGPNRIGDWRGIVAVLERKGFPKIDPLFGGRYFPAVRAWLDRYNELYRIVSAKPQQGRETWTKFKRAGSSGEPEKEAANVCQFGSHGRT